MELNGEHTFAAPREQVWDFLMDPEVLKGCLPGCEKMDLLGPDEYSATMRIGIAMIKGTFTGRVKISDKVEPSSYTMLVEGSGPQGQVSGTGRLELIEEGGSTRVVYTGDASVRGTIARVGARMIQPAARTIVGQFFGCLEKKATANET
jgi:carbon monoxide dehydrogenase subunit G